MNVKERCLKTAEMLKEILGSVDDSQIDEFVTTLTEAWNSNRKIFTIGAGRTNLISRTFAMRLMQISFRSFVVYDTGTPAFEPGDVLIAVSGSGTTQTVLDICAQVQKLKGNILAITMKPASALAAIADSVIVIPTDKRTEKIHTNGSEFEQSLFVLLDCIGIRIMENLNCINDISEVDRFIRVLHANLQ